MGFQVPPILVVRFGWDAVEIDDFRPENESHAFGALSWRQGLFNGALFWVALTTGFYILVFGLEQITSGGDPKQLSNFQLIA